MEELSDDEDDVGEVVGEVESVDSVELKDIRKGRGRSLQKSFNTALSHFSKVFIVSAFEKCYNASLYRLYS